MATQSSTVDVRQIPVKQYVTPTTGSTVTVGTTGYTKLVIDPAGSLLALTIAFPGSPTDGDQIDISCSQTVTTLTMNGGTILSPLTTLVLGSRGSWIYDATSTKWHPVG